MQENTVKIIECPRDAMQGWSNFIPTQKKIDYINALLNVGFDALDFGSFVSPKAIPQMADTKEVVNNLKIDQSNTKLLAIIANTRGAEDAVLFPLISYLGFPFSISETFQQRNANSTIADSLERVKEIQGLCVLNNKTLVVYISMGFGNPYGDEYHEGIVMEWVDKLAALGIEIIAVADTVGLAKPVQVSSVMKQLIPVYPGIEFGVHLHSTPDDRIEKLDAALEAGCRRFDGAINGIGGCPMAGNDLVGNMDTKTMVSHFLKKGFSTGVNMDALEKAGILATSVFV
jgi:hydroxymethylglutaryl-CoA lyase